LEHFGLPEVNRSILWDRRTDRRTDRQHDVSTRPPVVTGKHLQRMSDKCSGGGIICRARSLAF